MRERYFETPLEVMSGQVFGIEATEEQILAGKGKSKPPRPQPEVQHVVRKTGGKKMPKDGKR